MNFFSQSKHNYKDRMRHITFFCISVFSLTIVSALEIETNGQQPVPPGAIEASLILGGGDSDTNSGSDSATNNDNDNDDHCVWYDKCGQDPDFQDNVHNLNCVYQGKPG